MIRNVLKRPRSLSLCLLMPCMVIAFSSRIVYASTPNVNELQVKAQKGFVNQEIELAQAYFMGDGVAHDQKLAAYWYQKAAESGNPEAQNLVGYFYEMGLGVPVDAARAFHWYQLSAASGLSDATLNLGVLYVSGVGVKKDVAAAAHYFEEAARKGNGTGATYLGTLYHVGIGVNQDKVAAEHWYAIGDKMHDPISAYDLGTLYSTAPDHPHDFSKAARFLRQSTEARYLPAIHSLALLLIHHPELAKSQHEALDLLETAANAGYWKSSILLGISARDGIGIPVDNKAAYYHFRVAILQGGAAAQALVTGDTFKISNLLGPEQAQALDSETNLWFQQHPPTPAFVRVKGNRKFFSEPAHTGPADILNASLPQTDPLS